MPIRIVAIICARNEELYIQPALQSLISAGVDVVLVDHDSVDGTRALAEPFVGRGLLAIERLAWTGSFSLSEQLRAKEQIADAIDADWLLHADADEWLQAPPGFRNLREGIEVAQREGYDCINFDEFVFVPVADQNFENPAHRDVMRHYYFFAPQPRRLTRAWRKNSAFRNVEGAGHALSGETRAFPESFILRHYIVLSAEHAVRKYGQRVFAEEDLAKGWHRNRHNIPSGRLRVDRVAGLKCLAHPQSRHFDRSEALKRHFWEW